jgi:nucleoside-diphosphate-sugar epimerase
MHTILGSGGVIANELALALRTYTRSIRLVSRYPKAIHPTDECITADLLVFEQVRDAVAGSEVVYLTAGLPYQTHVWATDWPIIMNHVIKACRKSGSKLIFFDNVYAYGRVNGSMTEATPHAPCSKKGRIRAQIANQLLAELQADTLMGMLVRAADFYGPNSHNSIVHQIIFKRLTAGKSAQIIVSPDVPHTFSFTPDAGRAMALLGHTNDAFGQVWHLPAPADPITQREFLTLVAGQLGIKPAEQLVSKNTLRLLGLISPTIRENQEMLYQFEHPYLFNSDKFKRRFPDFHVHSYAEGITATLESLGKSNQKASVTEK